MPMPQFSSKASVVETKYMPLAEEEGSDSDLSLPRPTSRLGRMRTLLPWLLSAVLFVSLAVSLTSRPRDACANSSFETGFDTELVGAKPHIKLRPVKYTGTPQFDAEGKQYINYAPGEVRYVGPPSDEIDEAWNQTDQVPILLALCRRGEGSVGRGIYALLERRLGRLCCKFRFVPYVALPGELTILVNRDDTNPSQDHVRKSLHPEYYHQDHCIDHIRQQIMCQGDLTAMPTQFFELAGKSYLDADRTHMCRDFTRLREFGTLRYNQSLTGHEVPTGHYKPGHEGTSSWGPV
ncbi:hypothetical protein FB451DRAFT_1492234 [Mycena latifolia]|nr:hypothetical protein FB451DRAFT_1492234 [Mycena latifolia]